MFPWDPEVDHQEFRVPRIRGENLVGWSWKSVVGFQELLVQTSDYITSTDKHINRGIKTMIVQIKGWGERRRMLKQKPRQNP